MYYTTAEPLQPWRLQLWPTADVRLIDVETTAHNAALTAAVMHHLQLWRGRLVPSHSSSLHSALIHAPSPTVAGPPAAPGPSSRPRPRVTRTWRRHLLQQVRALGGPAHLVLGHIGVVEVLTPRASAGFE